MTTMINYVGRKGQVSDGDYAGYSIKIDDDRINTGGYLILVWKEGTNEGFDNWVETERDIEQYLCESDLKIDWQEPLGKVTNNK